MELKQLQRFVAVAQALNYRRAAAQLGITQPPLTRSIRELERTLGVTLLSRSRKEVSLTSAGRILLKEAPRLIAQAKLIESAVARTASDISRLNIGFVEPALYRIIPSIMPRFRARWPGLEVLLQEMPSSEQIARLQDGRLDLGFIMSGANSLEGLQSSVVERSRVVLAVPSGLPLAAKRQVRLEEVASQPFIMQSSEANPVTYNAIVTLCREAGFTPRTVQETNQAFTILKFVASGLGVGFVPEMAADLDVKGVKLLRIADRAFDFVATLSVAWARHEPPPEAREFVRMAEASGRTGRKMLRAKART